jgi:DNA ligase-1
MYLLKKSLNLNGVVSAIHYIQRCVNQQLANGYKFAEQNYLPQKDICHKPKLSSIKSSLNKEEYMVYEPTINKKLVTDSSIVSRPKITSHNNPNIQQKQGKKLQSHLSRMTPLTSERSKVYFIEEIKDTLSGITISSELALSDLTITSEEDAKETLSGITISSDAEDYKFSEPQFYLPDEKPFGNPVLDGYKSLSVAQPWEREDVSGWQIAQKYNGIRCYWNGFEMWSKKGRKYELPSFITDLLPKSPLDGEICLSSGSYTKCVAILNKNPSHPAWKNIKFVVNDAPELDIPFSQRLQALRTKIVKSRWVRVNKYLNCRGNDNLYEELANVRRQGGDGIIMKHPNSLYHAGKSRTSFLEVNSNFQGVARVLQIMRKKDKINSVRVKTEQGQEFNIFRGLKTLFKNPPKVGSNITYCYNSLLDNGKPRQPKYNGRCRN